MQPQGVQQSEEKFSQTPLGASGLPRLTRMTQSRAGTQGSARGSVAKELNKLKSSRGRPQSWGQTAKAARRQEDNEKEFSEILADADLRKEMSRLMTASSAALETITGLRDDLATARPKNKLPLAELLPAPASYMDPIGPDLRAAR